MDGSERRVCECKRCGKRDSGSDVGKPLEILASVRLKHLKVMIRHFGKYAYSFSGEFRYKKRQFVVLLRLCAGLAYVLAATSYISYQRAVFTFLSLSKKANKLIPKNVKVFFWIFVLEPATVGVSQRAESRSKYTYFKYLISVVTHTWAISWNTISVSQYTIFSFPKKVQEVFFFLEVPFFLSNVPVFSTVLVFCECLPLIRGVRNEPGPNRHTNRTDKEARLIMWRQHTMVHV